MKKLLLLIMGVLLLTGCPKVLYDDTPVDSITKSDYKEYKYYVTFKGNTEPVFLYTNKECTIGKPIWECK